MVRFPPIEWCLAIAAALTVGVMGCGGKIETNAADLPTAAAVPSIAPQATETALPGFITALASDATDLFAIDTTGGIFRIPKGGGPSVEILRPAWDGWVPVSESLAVDDTYLYWTTMKGGNVVRMRKTGGMPESIASFEDRPSGLVVDSERIYWFSWLSAGDQQPGRIASIPKKGGPVFVVAPNVSPKSLAIDGDTIYFADWDNAIKRVPKTGGHIQTLAFVPKDAGFPPHASLAVANGFVGWTGGSEDGTGRFAQVAIGGGAVIEVRGMDVGVGLASDGHTFYLGRSIRAPSGCCVENVGIDLVACPGGATDARVVAHAMFPADQQTRVATAIAIDSSRVYWVDFAQARSLTPLEQSVLHAVPR